MLTFCHWRDSSQRYKREETAAGVIREAEFEPASEGFRIVFMFVLLPILFLVSAHLFVPYLLILDPLALRSSPYLAWHGADFHRPLFLGPGLLGSPPAVVLNH